MTGSTNAVRVLRRADVLSCLDHEEVLAAVREALIAAAAGRVNAPSTLSFDFRDPRGEAHIKGAHIEGRPDWTVKLATGFYGNPELGLPTASGMSLVSSAETGLLEAIVIDGGFLTDARTAAAGCLAADALAPDEVERVGVIGCGIQARIQVEYLLQRRRASSLVVYGRDREKAQRCADEIAEKHGVAAIATDDPREAVQGSQLVITVTPSEAPIVKAAWLEPPVAVVAVGSDMPGKQELEAEVLERADLITADDPEQAGRVGELEHAPGLVAGAVALGDLLAKGTAREGGIAVADLTGLGAEDAAVAGLVAERARERDLGEMLEVT